jgi:RNA polymerase sigma-70 factor (ECF subfamily)
VGDANHGFPRIASVFVGLHPFAICRCPRQPLSPARSIFQMANTKFDPSNDRFTRGIIRRKINQLVRRSGFSQQERNDLEQDLLVRVLQSLPKFDPDQAHRNKFITTVVERYVANILRDRGAGKRDRRGRISLNVMIDGGEEGPTELLQTIGDRELDARLGRDRREEDELRQMAIDMAEVISTLPDSWQTLLELRKSRTMQQVADEMGVPRTTLNDWMRRIRQRFENAGMQDYLQS